MSELDIAAAIHGYAKAAGFALTEPDGASFMVADPHGNTYVVTVTRDADRDVKVPRIWELSVPNGRRYVVIAASAGRASMLAGAREPNNWSEPMDRGPAVEGTGF